MSWRVYVCIGVEEERRTSGYGAALVITCTAGYGDGVRRQQVFIARYIDATGGAPGMGYMCIVCLYSAGIQSSA